MSLLFCDSVTFLGVNFRVVIYHRVDLNSSARGGGLPGMGLSLETE